MSLNEELAEAGPSVPVDRFRGPRGRGVWADPPSHWSDVPDEHLMTVSTFGRVAAIASELSETQRRVFVLRDVEGWTAAEVCELLDLSEVNQRVLLHRARSRVRTALEDELEPSS